MNNHECMNVLGQMLCYICDNHPNGANSIDAEALTHAIEHMKRGAPEGWQLVPKKPTVEMIKAAWKAQYLYVGGNEETCETLAEGRASDVYQSKMDNVAYKAMLSAAPEPPSDFETKWKEIVSENQSTGLYEPPQERMVENYNITRKTK